MKKYLYLIFFLLFIPYLCFSATGDLETFIGKTDTTLSTVLGKTGTGVASILGKNYTDGDSVSNPAPVSRYLFESGALTTDSVGTNTLTSNGDPAASSTHKEGSYSVDLDGAGDYYSIADASLTADFPLKSGTTNKKGTFCFWFLSDNEAEVHYFMAKYLAATNGRSLAITLQWGTEPDPIAIFMGYNNGDSSELLTHASDIVANQWYHVAFSWDDADRSYRLRIWDDTAGAILGSDITGNYSNAIYLTTQPFTIGARADGDREVNGLMDDVWVFDEVLTTTQTDAIRAGTYTY